MNTEDKGQKKTFPAARGNSFFIVTTALVIALFTGGIVYEVQTVIGGGGQPVDQGAFVDGVRTFNISVEQWSFHPAVIKMNPGETVNFILTGKDVWHGFAVNELGINLAVPGGKTVASQVVIPENMPDGIYTFYCSTFCGLGHPYLKGEIIIGTPKLFLGVGTGKILPYVATLFMVVLFGVGVVLGGRRSR